MSLAVNHNSMAVNIANSLSTHYGNLAESTRRLSTGLRINSASDDASGLAVRELMRADISSLQQGIRNTNDAISLLQTADAALGIIDEKLIRMKELAEQAATGTYDSTQRLMIHSEFRQMAEEIDRIANATEFNGIHLLNGNLSGDHDGSGLTSTGKMKIHFGTGNSSAEDYYYIEIPSCAIDSLMYESFTIEAYSAAAGANSSSPNYFRRGLDTYVIPKGYKDITIQSRSPTSVNPAHKPHVNIFTTDGYQLTGSKIDDPTKSSWWNYTGDTNTFINTFVNDVQSKGLFDNTVTGIDTSAFIDQAGTTSHNGLQVKLLNDQSDDSSQKHEWEKIEINEVTDNLIFLIGGHQGSGLYCNYYDLTITGKKPLLEVETQEKAQRMINVVDQAIVIKDQVRAKIGALQNRFENTMTNLQVQSENIQAAESRISDVDVSLEMSNYVRNQILAQSSVAMLTQANSIPQMAMRLIGG